MSEENLEDWDTDFLEEAIKVEEQHLSSQYIPTTTTSFDKPPRFEQSSSAAFVRNDIMSYSPPRELSQTTAAYSMPILDRASNGIGLHSSPLRRSDNTKDREIERLKVSVFIWFVGKWKKKRPEKSCFSSLILLLLAFCFCYLAITLYSMLVALDIRVGQMDVFVYLQTTSMHKHIFFFPRMK